MVLIFDIWENSDPSQDLQTRFCGSIPIMRENCILDVNFFIDFGQTNIHPSLCYERKPAE